MSFELSAEEQLIVEAVHELAAGPNGRAHWRESALANTFPDRLWQALAEAGYLGLLVPPSASTCWGCRGAIERFPAAARGARAGAPPALPRPRPRARPLAAASPRWLQARAGLRRSRRRRPRPRCSAAALIAKASPMALPVLPASLGNWGAQLAKRARRAYKRAR